MKKIVVLLFAVLAPWTSFAWVPHMQFYVTPHYAQVQVANPTPYTAYCQGYAYGIAQNGFAVNSWFASYIPPYGYQYAYVYANGPFVFVNAWANIHCQ